MGTNDVKQSVKKYLNSMGHFAWIQNNVRSVAGRSFVGTKGVPDVCCILKGGRFAGFEIKTGRDKPSDHQLAFQQETERRGGYYFFVSSLDEVIAIFRDKEPLV